MNAVARVQGLAMTCVLQEDPALGEWVAPEELKAATAASVAAVLDVPRGPWEATSPGHPGGWLGLLVLDGLVARRITLRGTTWTELLGTGDLLEPWQREREIHSSIPPIVEFEVLAATRLAVLDRGFVQRMIGWPEVITAASSRLAERTRSLTYALAACGRVGVSERILLTMRHFADRWGRVTADGILVDLPGVTHELLASQVGAARPSVTTALGQMRARGEIMRVGTGTWLLPHAVPVELPADSSMAA